MLVAVPQAVDLMHNLILPQLEAEQQVQDLILEGEYLLIQEILEVGLQRILLFQIILRLGVEVIKVIRVTPHRECHLQVLLEAGEAIKLRTIHQLEVELTRDIKIFIRKCPFPDNLWLGREQLQSDSIKVLIPDLIMTSLLCVVALLKTIRRYGQMVRVLQMTMLVP